MRLFCTFLLLSGVVVAQDLRMIPALGDARMGKLEADQGLDHVHFNVIPPPGEHQGLTVTAWLRLPVYNDSQMTTEALWCHDPIEREQPDKLAGAGGWGGDPIDLTAAGGTVAFTGLVFEPYSTGDPVHDEVIKNNLGEYGVATIAGWSEQTITVSVGGSDLNVGSGDFNINVKAGAGDYVAISGAGLCKVGVSQTPFCRYHNEIDGVTEDMELTAHSIVTNEFAMLAWRWKCTAGGQVYKSDIGRIHAFDDLSITKTNAYCATMSSRGHYTVGLTSFWAYPPFDLELFDARVFGRFLTQQEMERIHSNGVQELHRRGLID